MSVHRVVALLRPPQAPFELSCASEVFGTARPGLDRRYEFGVCTQTPGQVPTTAGYSLTVPDGLWALERADTVVVPGWRSLKASPQVLEALVTAHRRGARIISICSGSFVLAQAGLLDGRTATAHWGDTAELARRFPQVRVDRDVLYIDHGDVATSAGTAAGIDLCLHLVRRDHGAAYAAHIARHMVMPPHREGGQLQYAALPPSRQPADSLAPVLAWAVERLSQPLTVQDLAAHASLSSRTLARRFTDQLGTGPGTWVLNQRIAAAQALLEDTDLSIDVIALRVGLSSATNLRRRFHNALRTNPAAYRKAFRRPPNAQ